MELVAIPYHALPCALEKFTVNGITADTEDFGMGFDEGASYAEDYACGNYVFEALVAAPKGVCEHYHITEDEWYDIACQLEDLLHVGECGWCI